MPTFSKDYIEPGIYVETEIEAIPSLGVSGPFTPCIVGTVSPYKKILATSLKSNSNVDYISYNNENIDYDDIDLTKIIVIKDLVRTYSRVLDIPQNVSAVLMEDGTLEEGTYYFKVTALNSIGETIGSSEVNATTTVNNKTIKISWSPVYGATSYRIYGGVESGDGNLTRYWTVLAPTTNKIIDAWDGISIPTGAPVVSTVLGDYDIIKEAGTGKAQISWIVEKNRPEIGTTSEVSLFVKKDEEKDYNPILFYSSEIQRMYNYLGDIEWDNENKIPKYSLPLGVSIAFANGASSVWCIPWKTGNSVENLLESIKNLKNPYPYTIVFLEGYQKNVASNLSLGDVTRIINHVTTMSSIVEQKERIAIFGAPLNADTDSNVTNNYIDTINQLKHRRIGYCYPSNVYVSIENVNREVNGSYIAAAISGLIDSVGISNSISGQIISGISGVNDILLRQVKNIIAGYGVNIVEDSLRLRHALTTDNTSFLTKELKVTRIVDYVSKTVRDALNGFVNQPYSSGLASSIGSNVKLLLMQMLNANIIYEYGDISVEKNALEPNQLDIAFAIKPTPDVNWIYVKIVVQA